MRYRAGMGKKAAWTVLFVLMAALAAEQAGAHGASYFPVGRFYKCYQDGGYNWPPDGSSMPNAGCRAMFRMGIANWGDWAGLRKVIPGYQDFNAVKAAIPDGTLCSANDPSFKGVDALSDAWYRTPIRLTHGKFQFKFEASATHSPNSWRFFLSNPGYRTTQPLRWSDLTQIYQRGDATPTRDPMTGKNFYIIDVPVPAGRTGDATLYVIWQRTFGSDEGFYQCSDITLEGEEAPGNEPDWFERGYFVNQAVKPNINDQVRFRVFSGRRGGVELVDVTLPITAHNHNERIWSKELAGVIQPHADLVKVGVKSGNDVRFDENNIYSNLVFLKNESDTMAMDIETPPSPQPGKPITVVSFNVPSSVTVGGSLPVRVEAKSATNQTLRYTWYRTSSYFSGAIGNNPSGAYVATESGVGKTSSVWVQITDGTHTVDSPKQPVAILPKENGGGGSCYEAWSASKVYGAISNTSHAARVTQSGRNYEQQHWTQGQNPAQFNGVGQPWKDLGPCQP